MSARMRIFALACATRVALGLGASAAGAENDTGGQVESAAKAWLSTVIAADPQWLRVFPAGAPIRYDAAHEMLVVDPNLAGEPMSALESTARTGEYCVFAHADASASSALVCGLPGADGLDLSRVVEVNVEAGEWVGWREPIVSLAGYGLAAARESRFVPVDDLAVANLGQSRLASDVVSQLRVRRSEWAVLKAADSAPSGGDPALFGAAVGVMREWRDTVDRARIAAADDGGDRLTNEWPSATMETRASRSAGTLAQRYGLVETGEVCRATVDSATLAGSFGCYMVRDDGAQDWITSTTTFVASSPDVLERDGAVVSFGPAGRFIVGDDAITPLDDMAAQTLAGTLPIDAAMPTIAARLDEFSGVLDGGDIARRAGPVVLAAVGLSLGLALLLTRRRRGRHPVTDAGSP